MTTPFRLVSAFAFSGGGSPSGVAFDSVADRVYVIDGATKLIDVASWDGSSTLAGLLWQPFFDASSHVLQGKPELLLLGEMPHYGILAERPSAAEELRVSPQARAESSVHGNTPWVVVDIASQQDANYVVPVPDGDNFFLDYDAVRADANAVRVEIGLGHVHSYQLTRVDTGAILGVATQSALDAEVVITSSAPLEAGVVYGVRRASNPSYVQERRCMVRYGEPGDLIPGGHPTLGSLQCYGDWNPGGGLDLSCRVFVSTPTPLMVAGALTFGARGTLGVDPVSQVGPNQYTISAGATLPLELGLFEGTLGTWANCETVVLPSVLSTVGEVLLLQVLAVGPNGSVCLTDILGGKILPP